MVQKRIRKASLSQALREGQERHLSDVGLGAESSQPKVAQAPVTPLTHTASPEIETAPETETVLPPQSVIKKAPYDPILPFVAPNLRPQPPKASLDFAPDALVEPTQTAPAETAIAVPIADIPPQAAIPETPRFAPKPEPEETSLSKGKGALSDDHFRVSEVVKLRSEAVGASKMAPTPQAQPHAPMLSQPEPAQIDAFKKPTPKAMNKPMTPPMSDAPTSLSALGHNMAATSRHLRHTISDEELEILNAAKTRIEMRLFWVSIGIAVGSSFGAIPSLMLFNQTHVLSLSGFFQNILFFAFTLLSLVLGVILVVKAQDIRRAYRDITARSHARDD